MNEKSAGKCGWHLGRMYRSWPVKCATIAVGLWSLCLSQAGALEFTADQITKINGKTQKANIYYRDNMWRIEHHTMGPVNVSIVRKDKQLVWLLLSRMKHFKTVPYNADQDLKVSERLEGEVSREEIGTEVREGHPTTLYEVTVREGERTEVYYQWLATDIRFPMKLAKKDGSWIVEYQHVKLRSVIDYLFQLPLNFEPLEEFDQLPAAPAPSQQPM
ncbi:hypothetical protein FBQ96_04405 [Nitrospirales bacterium NOB]|nr:MAG: hypothetical protein UZ03_NOB001003607 [Nitrospira sp. OLB3]MBV6468434.1 hypothetical protein [Nitrospirota bacterium]MCE7963948.1 hypothetical protein [Nitrospira sp. NTP2]MDL1888817.1 hypothetical protein [Nitrospirales bacterium NOB]MEB2339645.1 hypothetical protein [Nitrospirales bacterium]QOJ35627.1 MAG: hypothetical protein HRU82_12050 [Nitrospira sp.]